MLTGLQLFLATLTLLLVIALALSVRRTHERRERWMLAGVWAFAACAFALRAAVTVPTFVHANLHGTELVDTILRFPSEATFRAEYGQYSFFALGAVAAIFGRSFEVIAATNEAFAAAALALAAIIARRLSASWVAAFVTLTLGALFVPLVRLAASEDAHDLAMLLGLIGLWGFDVYASDRKKAPLVAGAAALVLMIHTRQTFFAWALCVLLIAVGRGGRALLRDWTFRAAAGAVLAALAIRVVLSIGDQHDATSLVIVGMILSTPSALVGILHHHPFLDVARFGPAFPIFIAAGVWRGVRTRGVLGALALGFAGLVLLTLGFGFPQPGVEYSFRSPALALGLVVAGVGAASLTSRIARLAPRAAEPTVLGFAVAGAALALSLPARRELRRDSPEHLEYLFAQAAAAALPHDFAWVTLPNERNGPSYQPPLGVFQRQGRRVDRISPDQSSPEKPRVFLLGVRCSSFGLSEVMPAVAVLPNEVTRDLLRRLAPVLFDREPLGRGVPLPSGPHPECAEIAARGTPIGPRGTAGVPPQDAPFVLYPDAEIPLQFYLLDSANR